MYVSRTSRLVLGGLAKFLTPRANRVSFAVRADSATQRGHHLNSLFTTAVLFWGAKHLE